MGIDFEGGGALFGNRKSAKQYDFENNDITTIAYTLGSVNEETAYTVPAGKTLFVSMMSLNNTDGDAHSWIIKFDDGEMWQTSINAKLSEMVEFTTPIPLTAGKTIKVDADHSGSVLNIIGWEI